MNSVSFGYLLAAKVKHEVLIVAEAAPYTALKNSEHAITTASVSSSYIDPSSIIEIPIAASPIANRLV